MGIHYSSVRSPFWILMKKSCQRYESHCFSMEVPQKSQNYINWYKLGNLTSFTPYGEKNKVSGESFPFNQPCQATPEPRPLSPQQAPWPCAAERGGPWEGTRAVLWGLPREGDSSAGSLTAIQDTIYTHMLHGAGIFTYIWLISMVDVGNFSRHGAFGIGVAGIMMP